MVHGWKVITLGLELTFTLQVSKNEQNCTSRKNDTVIVAMLISFLFTFFSRGTSRESIMSYHSLALVVESLFTCHGKLCIPVCLLCRSSLSSRKQARSRRQVSVLVTKNNDNRTEDIRNLLLFDEGAHTASATLLVQTVLSIYCSIDKMILESYKNC